MLHMIVNTHNAESCAFRGEEEEKHLVGALDGLEKAAADKGVELRGAWINRGAHEFFILVDSPDAHTVDEVLLATGLIGRTHSRVTAVITPAEAAPQR